MAAAAVAQVNGLPEESRPASPPSVNSSVKRKRDDSDDGSAKPDAAEYTKPTINGDATARDQKALIRDYFEVLQRYSSCFLILPISQRRCIPPVFLLAASY